MIRARMISLGMAAGPFPPSGMCWSPRQTGTCPGTRSSENVFGLRYFFLIACTICAVLGEGRWRGGPCSGRGETCTVSSWKIRNREEFRRLGAPKKYNQPPCQQFQSLPLLSHLLLGGPRQLTIVAISEHGFCFLNLTCLHVSVRRVARHV